MILKKVQYKIFKNVISFASFILIYGRSTFLSGKTFTIPILFLKKIMTLRLVLISAKVKGKKLS